MLFLEARIIQGQAWPSEITVYNGSEWKFMVVALP